MKKAEIVEWVQDLEERMTMVEDLLSSLRDLLNQWHEEWLAEEEVEDEVDEWEESEDE